MDSKYSSLLLLYRRILESLFTMSVLKWNVCMLRCLVLSRDESLHASVAKVSAVFRVLACSNQILNALARLVSL